MGFDCPPRQTTADFLTSITSPAERITRPGFEGKTPYTPDQFAAAWHKSDDRAQLLKEIEEFNTMYPVGGEHLQKFTNARRGKVPRQPSKIKTLANWNLQPLSPRIRKFSNMNEFFRVSF